MSSFDDVVRPIVPVVIVNCASGEEMTIFAMIDSGADRDVISHDVIKHLRISTNMVQMKVVTVDNCVTENRLLASFTLRSTNSEYIIDVNDALVGNLLTSEKDIPPFLRDLSDQPHVRGIRFPEATGGVKMIVGAAHSDAAIAQELR